jgi:predicted amidohydrolase
MNNVRAAAVQLSLRLLDLAGNTERACAAVHAAADDGAQLVVLPELLNTGITDRHDADFMTEFYASAEVFPGPCTSALAAVANARAIVVIAGFAERDAQVPGLMYNSAAVLGPSGPIGIYRKAHIPREEKHYFRPGDQLGAWTTAHGRLGVLVCADNSFPEAARVAALAGAEIIAIPYAAQRQANPQLYRWLAACRAYENQVYVVAANQCGAHDESEFAGTSTIAAPDGTVLATLGAEEGSAIADLSEETLVRVRLRQTRYRDRRPDLYSPLTCREGL